MISLTLAAMKTGRLHWWLAGLTALGIKLFSLFPDAVETYYSNGVYPWFSRVQRYLFGRLPFSIGDCLYALLILFLLYLVFQFLQRSARSGVVLQTGRQLLSPVFIFFLYVYIAFNLLWGLNYNRRGITHQLGIDGVEVKDNDIVTLMQQLAIRVNELDSLGKMYRPQLGHTKTLFGGSLQAYGRLASADGRFQYASPSLKASLFHALGNYLGYTGYYNPFTGEAQVNRAVPLFVQPFTSCHEIGHQLGYARENEANFAGYLAAKASPDPAFRYSVYFELYAYGRPYLHRIDSLLLKRLDQALRPGVKQDRVELERFYQAHQNPLERLIDRIYNQYLKANEQPEGKVTYSRVVLWLAAYHKKYGTL